MYSPIAVDEVQPAFVQNLEVSALPFSYFFDWKKTCSLVSTDLESELFYKEKREVCFTNLPSPILILDSKQAYSLVHVSTRIDFINAQPLP